MHKCAGGQFIVVDLDTLALALSARLDNSERQAIIGVGESGTCFARKVNPNAPKITVSTVAFNRDRVQRELLVEGQKGQQCSIPVDDVAVSGRTLEVVRQTLGLRNNTVGIGLLYDSRKTRARIEAPDIRFGLLYSREGGGTPPMNSISTLRDIPERLEELVERYFMGSVAIKRLIKGENS